jgi:GAF domain-containing protein/serine phosphatase RsbU (regulator of sigma subunit)
MRENPVFIGEIISQIEKTIEEVFYLFNIDKQGYEFMSSNSEKVTGAKPSFFYSGKDFVKSYVHSEDQEFVYSAYQAIQNDKLEQKISFRIVDNNVIRWVHESFYPVLDDNGKLIKVSGIMSDITDKVNNTAELKKVQESTKLLFEIGYEIGEHLNVKSIVKSIYNRLNNMIDAEFFGIGIVNNANQSIDFPYFLENETEIYTSMSLNSNVLAAICVRTNESIIINNIEIDLQKYTTESLGETDGSEPLSVLYFPLRSKGEVIGVITVQSRKLNAYSETDIELLKNLSVYVSRSIINANLYESLEQMVEERTFEVLKQKNELEIAAKHAVLLSQMGNDLSTSLDFEDIFEKLHLTLNKLLDAEMFGLRTFNEDRSAIDYKFEIESNQRQAPLAVPLIDTNNYSIWCVTHGKHIHINNNLVDYKNYVDEIKVPAGKMPLSLLFVPIIHDHVVLGLLTVQSFEENAYSERHLNVMKTLSFYTGIAISNATLYKSLETKVKERTLELKQANKSVLDSINYTKNIQNATLTKDKDIKALLPKSFIYYKPRDIVSGDFYKIDKLKSNKGNDLISILVADCTGHGVPGATLAILFSSIINQSYLEDRVNHPGEVLEFARSSIISLFESSDSESTIYDGMDVALALFNPKTYNFSFAGAFSNCYIIRNGGVIILKGDRMHVGYSGKNLMFNTQVTTLEPNDFVVFSTDGYLDQFGGKKFKKFGRKPFVKMIKELQGVEPELQEERFNTSYLEWKANYEQTDDICVFGFTVE